MSGANVNMNVKVRRLDGTNIDHDMNLGSADDASQPYDDLEKGYGLFVIRAVTDIDPFWHRSIPDLTQQPHVKAVLNAAGQGAEFPIAGYHCLYVGPKTKTQIGFDRWTLEHNEYLGYDVTHLGGKMTDLWKLGFHDTVNEVGTGHRFEMDCYGHDIIVSNARLKKTNPQRPKDDGTNEHLKDTKTLSLVHVEYGPVLRPELKGKENLKW